MSNWKLVRVDNQARTPSEGEVGKDPLKKYNELVFKTDQVVYMDKQPDKPSPCAAHLQTAD